MLPLWLSAAGSVAGQGCLRRRETADSAHEEVYPVREGSHLPGLGVPRRSRQDVQVAEEERSVSCWITSPSGFAGPRTRLGQDRP